MLPVKDDIPTDRAPLVTLALIAASVLAILLAGEADVRHAGLVPAAPTAGGAAASLFAHEGLLQLAVAMLFLWLFGPSVEDALGRVRFVALYLAGGLVALAVQVAIDPGATTPVAAAAGAVAAVLGAYLRLYPWGRILTVVLGLLFFTIVAIPVSAMVAAWVAVQGAFAAVDGRAAPFAAQLAGVAFGFAVARLAATRVKTPEALVRRGRTALL